MNKKEGLNLLDFLPTGLDKQDPFIQALYSNDDGEGAIANEVEEAIAFIDYYTRTDDARNHRSDSLEMITRQFAKITRQMEEQDPRLLRRMLSLTERKGDVIWGNGLDIRHVFETYFENIKAFISENTNAGDENLLKHSDFEDDEYGDADESWDRTGSAVYAYEARFSGKRGVYFDGTEAGISQTARNLAPGLYTLHFFLLGKCGVIIKNKAGQFWDGTAKANNYVLAWKNREFVNQFENVEWNDVFCFIRLETELLDDLTIEFVSLENEAGYADYTRLFPKTANPSYTITFQFEGYTLASKTLHLGAPKEDPADGVNYAKESYFDRSYIVGLQGAYKSEVYQSVLDAARPRGIQAFAEFVEKTDTREEQGGTSVMPKNKT
jgi:hypothetical protein